MSSLRPFSQGPGPHRGQEGQAELQPLGGGTHLREDRVIGAWGRTGRVELGGGRREPPKQLWGRSSPGGHSDLESTN